MEQIIKINDNASSSSSEDEDEEQRVNMNDVRTPIRVDSSTHKRRRRSSPSAVTMKTVFRWKSTGDVNIDHLLGCGDVATPAEVARAEEILTNSGQLVCILCNFAISANKKCVRRHQIKNRKHLNAIVQVSNGTMVLDPSSTLANISDVSSRNRSKHSNSTPGGSSSLQALTKSLFDPGQNALAREAWELLQNPEKIADILVLNKMLDSLGVYDCKDLVYCEEKEILEIADTLKKVPQRRFYEIFGIAPPPEEGTLTTDQTFAALSQYQMNSEQQSQPPQLPQQLQFVIPNQYQAINTNEQPSFILPQQFQLPFENTYRLNQTQNGQIKQDFVHPNQQFSANSNSNLHFTIPGTIGNFI